MGTMQAAQWQEPSVARTLYLITDLAQLAAEGDLKPPPAGWAALDPSADEAAKLHADCQGPTSAGTLESCFLHTAGLPS